MFEYSHAIRRPPRTANRTLRKVPEGWTRPTATTVVMLLEPSMRTTIDGVANATFTKVHVNSVAEAHVALRKHSASALLLSPSIAGQPLPSELAKVIVKSPGVTPIAVLGAEWATAHQSILALGACGVRHVVNLAEREGWNQLRALLDNTGGDATAIIMSRLLSSLEGATDESRQFFASVVQSAPAVCTVKALAGELGIEPSTLMSRFFRAALPPPKTYLAMMRLVYAASFFETPGVSMADVAHRLNYSSPQSFGRNVRILLGLTGVAYRRDYSLAASLDHYIKRLILPYRDILRSFRPLCFGSVFSPGRDEKPIRELRVAEGA